MVALKISQRAIFCFDYFVESDMILDKFFAVTTDIDAPHFQEIWRIYLAVWYNGIQLYKKPYSLNFVYYFIYTAFICSFRTSVLPVKITYSCSLLFR